MKIGLVSDTHDNLPMIAKAVKIFNRERVEMVLHAGDFVAPFTTQEFQKLRCKLIGVFGNCDGEKFYLRERFERAKFEIYEEPYEMEVGGRKILLTHYDKLLGPLIKCKRYNLIVYGHTHKPLLQLGKTLVINPGECGGWLFGKSTIAIVDLEEMAGKIIEL